MADKNLPYFLAQMLGICVELNAMKAIGEGKIAPRSKDEEAIKAIADAHAFLARSLNSRFSIDLVKKCYFLLQGSDIEDELAEQIALAYLASFRKTASFQAESIVKAIRKEKPDGHLAFALLLVNHLYERKGMGLIIRPPYYGEILEGLTDKKKTRWMFARQCALCLSSESGDGDRRVPLREIKAKIAGNRRVLLQRFNVENIWLVEPPLSEPSDRLKEIHLLIRFLEETSTKEQNRLLLKVERRLQNALGIPVSALTQGSASREYGFEAIAGAKALI